jgi:serine/threonine-protein kinase
MSGTRSPGNGGLSTSLIRRCNAVCDRFEAAWQAVRTGGHRPLLEPFLASLPEPERSILLPDLILLEVHYRRLAGETCTAADYRERFAGLDPVWLTDALKSEEGVLPVPTTLNTGTPKSASVVDGPGVGVGGEPRGKDSLPARYTREHLHATGGIGQVWIARDHDIGRQVALKELRPDRASNAILRARFLSEARITGQLEHPGIVPVYEVAWQPEDGEPYYTMRFVKGRTLRAAAISYHQQCQQSQAGPLELRGLLDSFISVCNVVAYAHSKGVLHRDLKGQNVILGDYGEVFLLDWGLAKVVGARGHPVAAVQTPPADRLPAEVAECETALFPAPVVDPTEQLSRATVEGQVLGTPGYMAPEQAAGQNERITERTDVYGLGAILYEILTGQAPFRGKDVKEVLVSVQQGPLAAPRALIPGLDGALEAICLKALSKAPEARFASAQEMAQEIRRYLAGAPVACYPDPWTVRARRWMGRHRTVVSGIAAALVVALISLGAATLLLNSAKERERLSRMAAEDNFHLAQDIVDRYLVQVSGDERLKSLGMEKLRRDLLLQAKEIYEQFARRGASGPALEYQRAKALHGLGLIEADIGDRDKARELYENALALLRRLTQQQPQPGVEDSLAGVACDLGRWHFLAQQPEAALPYYEQALTIHRGLAEDAGATADQRYQLALTLHRFGIFCINTGKVGRGKELLEEAVAALKRLVEEDPHMPIYLHTLASCYLTLNYAYRNLQQFDQVEPVLQQCLKVRETLNRAHPDVPPYQMEYANTLIVLADWYALAEDLGYQKRAAAMYDQALLVFEKLAYYHPDVLEYQKKRIVTLLDLTTLHINTRQPSRLKDDLDRALPVLDQLAKDHADDSEQLALRLKYGLAEAVWHALTGHHVSAAALLEQRRADLARSRWPKEVAGDAYYNIACFYCLTAEAARVDHQLAETARTEAADRYLTQALNTLKQGGAAGFFKGAGTLASLKADKDLTLLRARADFQKWLQQHEAGLKTNTQ